MIFNVILCKHLFIFGENKFVDAMNLLNFKHEKMLKHLTHKKFLKAHFFKMNIKKGNTKE